MEKKKTVVVYESFYEAIQLLSSQEAQMELFNGMMRYGLYGEEPEFNTQELKLTWALYRPNMDANIARYNKAVESGRKSAGNRNPKKPIESTPEVKSFSTGVAMATPTVTKNEEVKTNIDNIQKLINYINNKEMKNKNNEEYLKSLVNEGDITSINEIEDKLANFI
jgi:hypothetical protein